MESSSSSAVANQHNQHNPFLRLPGELILQCLAYIPPLDLINFSAASRDLRQYAHDDKLWQRHVNVNLSVPLSSSHPFASYKDLYKAHYPYWFLPRNKLWFSDANPCGMLAVARYNQLTGCVEAHTVVAERGQQIHQTWDADPEVVVIGFDPQVKLHLDAPILRLPATDSVDWRQEINMDCSSNSPGLRTSLVLSRDHPNELLYQGSAVWPAPNMPAVSRTRNLSVSDFKSSDHHPKRFSDISQNTFRIRKWVEYHGRTSAASQSSVARFQAMDRLNAAAGLNMFAQMNPNLMHGLSTDRRGDRVTTFGTIDPAAYTPTPLKPWRGIWSGDYSGHGIEFLLIMQLDEAEQFALPSGLNWLMEWLTGGRRQEQARNDVTARTWTRMNEIIGDIMRRDHDDTARAQPERADQQTAMDLDSVHDWLEPDAIPGDVAFEAPSQVVDPEETYTGKLVAFKLTGDPNVPRGQITFIAPDLREGYVRTADDNLFRGSRVVRAAGHIANHGFIFDEYIPSELILVSHDMIAQHWQGFGHISFFKRVDIDALLAQQA